MNSEKLSTDNNSIEYSLPLAVQQAISVRSEREIWIDFKNGSDSAFTYIYREYLQKLFNYGMQISNDGPLIQDCIQDTFMDIIRNRSNLADVQSIKFYLFTALRHKVFRKLKKERNMHGEEWNEESAKGFEMVSSHEVKMINNQLDEDKQRLLNMACERLTKKQREAILLYYYEGFSYMQVAEILGMDKVKSVRVLIYRAIDVLHGHLSKVKDQLMIFIAVCLSIVEL